jgi:hypothetical protein
MDGRASGLGRRRVPNFDEAFLVKASEESDEIALAAGGLDVVFLEDGGVDFGDAVRLLEKAPDARPHGIECVIDTVFEVENGGFGADFAGHLIARRHYHRLRIKFRAH